MTEREKTGALLVYLFACLHYDEDRERDVWWYAWCVGHSTRARTKLERAVWWALRHEDRDPEPSAADWLGYVAYVLSTGGA